MDMTLWDAEQQQQGNHHMALGSPGPFGSQLVSWRKTHPVGIVVAHSRGAAA